MDINEFQKLIQTGNARPIKLGQGRQLDHSIKKKVTDVTILSDGDIFGEIGMLTNLRRTCSVITQDTCVFQTLSKDSMNEIKEMFPSIFEHIYGNMFSYNDEDMMRRRQFVENIPYLRGLDPESITEIAYLMR